MNLDTAEATLVCASIIEPTVLDRVAGIVSRSDFVEPALGRAFELVADMRSAGQPIDATLVSRTLDAAGLLSQLGGLAGFGRLLQLFFNAAHATNYAQEIATASQKRRLCKLAKEFTDRVRDPQAEPVDLVAWIEAQLPSCASQEESSQLLGDAMTQMLDGLAEAAAAGREPGLPTGLWRIDETLGAMHPGELIVLAARPSIGKSALGQQITESLAERGQSVMFASLEMTREDIATRSLAWRLGVDIRRIRHGLLDTSQTARSREITAHVATLPFYVWARRHTTVGKLRAEARVRQATDGLDFLTVDYLQLISGDRRHKDIRETMVEVSGGLKSLALELQIPILALAQLNREAERSGKPGLHHLSESGSIEQDADVVMLLHRDDKDSTSATLRIAKNRSGACGCLALGFEPGFARFTDAPEWSP